LLKLLPAFEAKAASELTAFAVIFLGQQIYVAWFFRKITVFNNVPLLVS
jgi:hypothetical protein